MPDFDRMTDTELLSELEVLDARIKETQRTFRLAVDDLRGHYDRRMSTIERLLLDLRSEMAARYMIEQPRVAESKPATGREAYMIEKMSAAVNQMAKALHDVIDIAKDGVRGVDTYVERD